nr:nucleolar protein dao-5-like isoform X4 [Cherax quadricarinatus]
MTHDTHVECQHSCQTVTHSCLSRMLLSCASGQAGGGGDGRESSGAGSGAPSSNGQQQQQQQQQLHDAQGASSKRSPAQKGLVSFVALTSDVDQSPGGEVEVTLRPPAPGGAWGLPPLPQGRSNSRYSSSMVPPDTYGFAQDNSPASTRQRAPLPGPNDLIFGEDDKSSGLSYKDREERLRQLRERQQLEKQQKLEELKEQGLQSKAAAAQRFREQQENERRRRLEEMRLRDADRRSQVEERKRIIQQAEQDRREAVIRKNAEREHRLESKRRNERSNIVFAFGSSTPRMLDPKDNSTNASYWSSRRATSTTNVHLVDTSITRRASECGDIELSRKRATSAQSLDRKPEDLRMSSSMYEVFHWDESGSSHQNHAPTTQGTRLTKSRDSSLERKTPPSALSWVRSSTPQPTKSSSFALSSKDTPDPPPPSSTSSSSSDKTPTNASQSRFCVWEFGDNFAALGPANQSSGGSGNPVSASPASTPTSSTCYSRRTASVFTGAGCTIGGEDLMTRSMTAAIPTSAARRRTDLIPAMPSLRDSSTPSRSSPRHRSPGRALSLGRLDELACPRHRKSPLAPLHESTPSSVRMSQPARTMSKSMCHLGPRPARPQTLDTATGRLDRGVSRSSVTLVQPRMTRAEILRQKKLRGNALSSSTDNTSRNTKSTYQGMRSGTVTPNSPSRPTSALSQGSNNSSQVSLRSRTSPRKPRPLSIAGSSLSSADKPRDASTPSRESRPMERKLSVGASLPSAKPTRAKSVGSDRSAPATPARTPAKTTPKKTPSQVKAESAAKKAVEKSKTTPKSKPTPKTTPVHSPLVESKPSPGVKDDKKEKDDKAPETKLDVTETKAEIDETATEKSGDKVTAVLEPEAAVTLVQEQPDKDAAVQIEHHEEDLKAQDKPTEVPVSETKQLIDESVKPVEATVEKLEPQPEPVKHTPQVPAEEQIIKDKTPERDLPEEVTSTSVPEDSLEKLVEDTTADQEKTLAQKAAEKPVTGYATEEEYKAALAEKRRLAREAKEREQELERQRQLEEEERERKEEEEFLRLIEEQKKAEEERLKKAIEEADRNREEEARRREEEEKQREEAERIEHQKRLETEERLRREEEERQARKSRVAAIMARTRGKGGSNTPTKAEAKTPSDEAKNFGDGEMSVSMTDSMISLVTASESQAESRPVTSAASEFSTQPPSDVSSQPPSDVSSQPPSDVSSQPPSDVSSQPPSDVSSQPPSDVSSQPPSDVSSQLSSDVSSQRSSDVISQPSSDTYTAPTNDISIKSVQELESTSQNQTFETVEVESKYCVDQQVLRSNVVLSSNTEHCQVDDLISGMASVRVEEPHINGDTPVPMDTTPTQSVDLLGSLSDVHSVNHNGVDNTPPHTTQGDNLLGSLDPLNSSLTSTTSITSAASNFEQIIDLGQTKLSNEDAVNSNPPSPFIAFEQNLNKKQNQENTSTVPDLLL